MVNFFPYDRYDFDLEMVDQLSKKLLNMEGRRKIMQLPVIKLIMIWRLRIHIFVLRLPDFWSNWNLEMLVFEEREKLKYPEKNLLEQRREPTTNSTHIMVLTPGFQPRP